MLSFLSPGVLFAAIAALIPLIIHLFSKRRVKIIEFSSVRHLKAMQKRQVRRLKIRQLLLLLLRMLIILALVLAFARPSTTDGSIGTHASVSAVILLDNSASMNRYVADGNLFQIAKETTERLLDGFGESDQVALVPLDEGIENSDAVDFSSASVTREKLADLDLGYAQANLENGLERAVSLMAGASDLNKEIYLISDHQRFSLPEAQGLSEFDGAVYLVDLPIEPVENCGITAVDFGGQLILPGHEFQVTATVRNYGPDDRSDLIASLFIDGNRVAQRDFVVDGNGENSVRFAHTIARGGFHSGYIDLSDDKFITDNRYYFSLKIPSRFNVLIVDNGATGQLIALALTPSASLNQYWSVKRAGPDDLAGVDFRDYDVVVLTSDTELSKTYLHRLKSFVSGGRSLFLVYGPSTATKSQNSDWSEVSGVHYDKPIPQHFTRAGYYGLMSVEADHPIFSVFKLESGHLPEIKFFALPKLHLSEQTRTLLRFTGDRPALVESTFGSGKVLTFTAPLGTRYTDLAEHAFFVPFVSRIVEYLASNLSELDLHLYSGDNISRSIALRGSITSSVRLLSPDSIGYSLPPQEEQGSLVVMATPVAQPGIYRLQYAGVEIDRFAVNVNPTECDLTSVDHDQFAAAIGADQYQLIGHDLNIAALLSELRFGKELWQLFLWLAALLLLAEMLLSRTASTEE